MSNFDELRDILTVLLTQRFAPMPRFVRGLMGDGLGRVRDPENPDTHVLVRPNRSASETFSVFNKLVPLVDGTPILIGELPWQPGLTQVVGIDWQAYPYGDWSGYAGAAPHGPTHEWGDAHVGADAFTVYGRQLGPLRTYSGGSGSMSVYLAPYEYDRWGEGVSWVGLPGLDLSPAIPATGTARLMLTYLDLENNVPGVVTGTLDVYSDAIELPRPWVPTGTWEPSAWVRLYGGQSTISEVNDIWDARILFGRLDSPTGPAGGDLTGTFPDPTVWGLFGHRIADETPAEGEVLTYTGSFWRPHLPTAQPPTGPAGGDLTGTYPAPWVAGIYNHPYGGETPEEYDVLMYTGSAWRPQRGPFKLVSPGGVLNPALYVDTAGNIRAVNDVYPAGNEAGAQRRLDHFYLAWDEHFDGSSMPAGWSWAGSPFVVPGYISHSAFPSVLTLGLTGATGSERAFLYRTTLDDNTYLQCSQQALGVDTYTGLRLDDGSDDNYVEFVVNLSTATPTDWQLIVRYRTGGGAVTVLPAVPTTIYVPAVMFLQLSIGGTKYTNWYISAVLRGLLSAGLSPFWQTSASPAGLAWTPTRRGIVVSKATTATWYQHYIDSFHPN